MGTKTHRESMPSPRDSRPSGEDTRSWGISSWASGKLSIFKGGGGTSAEEGLNFEEYLLQPLLFADWPARDGESAEYARCLLVW